MEDYDISLDFFAFIILFLDEKRVLNAVRY